MAKIQESKIRILGEWLTNMMDEMLDTKIPAEECESHTVYKLIYSWVTLQDIVCLCICSKISSDWLPTYIWGFTTGIIQFSET